MPITWIIDTDGRVRDRFIEVRDELLNDIVVPLCRIKQLGTANELLVRCSVLAAFATATGILIAATPAVAGAWVADAKSGCQVWNPNPQLEETVAWSGPCANGRAHGHGTAQWVKGGATSETDEGEWREGRQTGKGTQSWATGRYEGELADGEPNGHGVLIMQRLRYEGDFRNGKPNGVGTLTAGGESVQGIWKDGCLQGARKASIGVPLSACR